SNQTQQKSVFLPRLITTSKNVLESGTSFIFSGVLLGALPLWNTPMFIAAAAVLLFLLILFPHRLQMMLLGITAALLAAPQLLSLRSGDIVPRHLFYWGDIIPNPTVAKVIGYIAFTLGAKWPVIILALILAS